MTDEEAPPPDPDAEGLIPIPTENQPSNDKNVVLDELDAERGYGHG